MLSSIGVTGFKGLIGKSIVDYALLMGIKTYEVDFRKKLMPKPGHTVIIASGDSRKFWAQENPVNYFLKEINHAIEVFSFCRDNGNKVVLISTTQLNSLETILTPNSLHNVQPKDYKEGKTSTYSTCKFIIELLCRDLISEYFIARTCGVISKRLKKGTVHDLVVNGRSWVNPESRLQIISDLSLAKYVIDAVSSDATGTFNLVPNGFITWNDLINRIDRPLLLQKVCQSTHLVVDNAKLRELLKYEIKSCSEELDYFFESCLKQND